MDNLFEIVARNLETDETYLVDRVEGEGSASYLMVEHQISYGSGFEVTYRPSPIENS